MLIEGTYPVLNLNDRSRSVLTSKEKVQLKEFKVEKKAHEDNELFEILRAIRQELARENNIPPYIIFGDVTLKEMAANYPICKEAMLKISGVGEVKYSKYGKAFEDAIKKFTEEHNIEVPNYEEATVESKNHEVKDNDLKLEVTTDLELYNRLQEARKEFAKKERVATTSNYNYE